MAEEPGRRTYVSVDGGMSDNPRPQLYDAIYSAMVANRAYQPRDRVVTVAGKHCETDILIWNVELGPVCTGDIVAVQTTGAYNYAMASNYNRFVKPAVVLVRSGQSDVICSRETLHDLLQLDRMPSRLSRQYKKATQAVSPGADETAFYPKDLDEDLTVDSKLHDLLCQDKSMK